MSEPSVSGAYYIASYVVDGELSGIEPLSLSDLSSHWLDVCRQLIEGLGSVFDERLQGQLSSLRIKYTSAQGAALILVSAHDRPAVSAAFVSGLSEEADRQVLNMLAESAGHSLAPWTSSRAPFAGLPELRERPLLTVIPYPDPLLTSEEHELAKELIQHLAGAHLRYGACR